MYYKLIGRNKKGFTLLELLIVIAIIAILSVILILVLDPAETLKKSRDSQRIADLNTLKTAIGIWTTTTSTPWLGGAAANTACKVGTASGGTYTSGVSRIFYSLPTSTQISDVTLDATANTSSQASVGSSTLTDGTGWLPVNFDQLTGGSPISNLPLDPTNAVVSASAIAGTDQVYRYVCNASTTKWEADAELESNTFTVQDNKESKDGGNNPTMYETGTDLKLLGSAADF